jgi:hypothetical protein
MKIQTRVNAYTSTNILIFPLLADDQLETHLLSISESTGLKADLMIREFKAEPKENLLLFHPESDQKIYLLGVGF